jgi:hypothetical protein
MTDPAFFAPCAAAGADCEKGLPSGRGFDKNLLCYVFLKSFIST